jgi:hypothetical protein
MLRTLLLMAVYIFCLCKFNSVMCSVCGGGVYAKRNSSYRLLSSQMWIIITLRVWLLVVLPFCHYDRLKRLHWKWTPSRILKPIIYMLLFLFLLLHNRVQQNMSETLSRFCCSVLVSFVKSSSLINCLIAGTFQFYVWL